MAMDSSSKNNPRLKSHPLLPVQTLVLFSKEKKGRALLARFYRRVVNTLDCFQA